MCELFMCGICTCWNVNMYISCVLCFQSGERVGATPPSSEKEMVAAGGDQVHQTWQVEIVSKILCIVLSEVVCE